jgi:transposase
VASPARRLSALAHRSPPLRLLGRRRDPGAAARCAARPGARGRRPDGRAHRGGHRLPVGPGQRLGLTVDQGYDAAKKVHGRKRHLAVDTCGLLLEILITPASVQDRDGGRRLLWRLRRDLPTIRLVWADAGYAGKLVTWANRSSPWPSRSSASALASTTSRFCLAAGSWSAASPGSARCRRLAVDYERKPEHHQAWCSGP